MQTSERNPPRQLHPWDTCIVHRIPISSDRQLSLLVQLRLRFYATSSNGSLLYIKIHRHAESMQQSPPHPLANSNHAVPALFSRFQPSSDRKSSLLVQLCLRFYATSSNGSFLRSSSGSEDISACSAPSPLPSTRLKWVIAQIFLRERYLVTPRPLAFPRCKSFSAPQVPIFRHSPTPSEHIYTMTLRGPHGSSRRSSSVNELKWFIAQILLRERYLATSRRLAFLRCMTTSAPHSLPTPRRCSEPLTTSQRKIVRRRGLYPLAVAQQGDPR